MNKGQFMICTFLGHRDTPVSLKPVVKQSIVNLIENEKVETFYVGNHGAFDSMVASVLDEVCQQYDYVTYHVILAYLPTEKEKAPLAPTIFPEGIETVPKRFAITFRNKWMIKSSDYVIAYVTHSWGGAAQHLEYARRQNKIIINLAE